jgi:hypothetical protein
MAAARPHRSVVFTAERVGEYLLDTEHRPAAAAITGGCEGELRVGSPTEARSLLDLPLPRVGPYPSRWWSRAMCRPTAGFRAESARVPSRSSPSTRSPARQRAAIGTIRHTWRGPCPTPMFYGTAPARAASWCECAAGAPGPGGRWVITTRAYHRGEPDQEMEEIGARSYRGRSADDASGVAHQRPGHPHLKSA